MRKVYSNPKVYTYRPQKEPKSIEISPKFIIALFVVIVLIGLVYFFLFSDYFKIKNIYIAGAGDYENDINTLIQQNLSKRSNFFLFPDSKVERDITNNYSTFKSAQIYKGFPNALKVELELRKPALECLCKEQKVLIDEDGYAYKSDKEVKNLPGVQKDKQVNLGDKVFSVEFVKFIQDLSEDFPVEIHQKIEKIVIPETDYVVEVYTKAGWKAIFDTTKDLNKQLSNLSLVLSKIGSQKFEYIDVRLEEKVYYK